MCIARYASLCLCVALFMCFNIATYIAMQDCRFAPLGLHYDAHICLLTWQGDKDRMGRHRGGGGCRSPHGVEDVIPHNRWAQKPKVSGMKESVALPVPKWGRRPKLGHKPIESLPHRFYVWIEDDVITSLLSQRLSRSPCGSGSTSPSPVHVGGCLLLVLDLGACVGVGRPGGARQGWNEFYRKAR